MKADYTFLWGGAQAQIGPIPINTEAKTGKTFEGLPVYQQLVMKGNPFATTPSAIAGSGTIVNNVVRFLGVDYGVIARSSSNQVHNINAVNNLPDQHSSIIFYNNTAKNIQWYFAQNMTLSSFKNMPFLALIYYTKAT